MKLRELVAQKFDLDIEYDGMWQPIHCPFHNDNSKSAAISFMYERFNCLAGCDSRSLSQFAKDIKLVRKVGKATEKKPIVQVKQKTHTVSHQADALLSFLESRKLSMKTVSELGGELVMNISDPMYGYLTFPIEGGRVGRKILPVEGPRFYTFIGNKSVSNNLKGLLGLENVPLYSDLLLTEGLTDHLTLKELGYGNIICSLGAGISDYQAYLLRNKTIFSLYDRDYTGFKKSRAAQGRLAQYGANLIILEIPERFGRPTGKIDISSAYTARGRELKEWIDYEVSKYSDNDKGYISLMSSSEKLEYFPTGISVIDEALEGGFTQGLYGIGGETSTGKSTVAVILAKAFVNLKKSVCYQTYELPKRQVWARHASSYSKYSWVEIERNPSIVEMHVLAKLEEDSNYLKVASDQTIEEFRTRVRNYQIIIVDYLQRMPRGDKDVNTSIRLNNEFLSQLSMQGKTVIILSSMPRSAYGHSDSDELIFKGSGDIEYSTQANLKLTKVGESRIFAKFTKNTRGMKPRGFLDMDWRHQTLKETDYEQ